MKNNECFGCILILSLLGLGLLLLIVYHVRESELEKEQMAFIMQVNKANQNRPKPVKKELPSKVFSEISSAVVASDFEQKDEQPEQDCIEDTDKQITKINVLSVSANRALDENIGDSLYRASQVLSSSRKTAWAAKYDNKDELCLTFSMAGNLIKKISVVNGNLINANLFEANARARGIRVSLYDERSNLFFSKDFELEDGVFKPNKTVSSSVDLGRTCEKAYTAKLCINSLYSGTRWKDDVYITSISFYGK